MEKTYRVSDSLFLDERYLKADGKPVFCIYQPCDIYCMKAMLEVWDVRLKRSRPAGNLADRRKLRIFVFGQCGHQLRP